MSAGSLSARVLTAAALVGIYILWTGTADGRDLAVISAAALIVSLAFVRPGRFPSITPKRLIYGVGYVFYLFAAIVKANLDVASRVIRPRIPLNPGIVTVRTKLQSRLGRTVLANSITLTPGTLSVEIEGDRLFIHWIDVTDTGEEEATRNIVGGFERYLEVIFG
jgi:multicomponent Na+:H+ antiporter subunit E